MTVPLAGAAVAALVVAIGTRPPARRWPGPHPAAPPTASIASARAWGVRLLEWARPQRRRWRRDAQLPDALDRLASALRAGLAIGPALAELATSVPEPLRADLQPIASAIDNGSPVAAALAGWAEGPGASADVRLVVAALTLGAQAGGEIARAVDRISATLRERREVQGEVRALATQAHTSAGVLAIAPLAFAMLVTTIEPGAVAFLVTSPLGLLCLLVGLGLEVLGAVWMTRITRSAS